MILKRRGIPYELAVTRSLNTRMFLSADEKRHLVYLEKGYHGEIMFDQFTEKLSNDVIVLNDLCLEVQKSTFQIDTLIISQHTIYLFEVKNFDGDYYYEVEKDCFKKVTKTEIKNPLDQLKRCQNLLRQLLQSLGYHQTIERHIVFINPEFTLFQSPLNAPIIYPTQLNRYIQKLDQIPSKLNDGHRKLANQLVSMHQYKTPYTKLPSYEYEQQKKGIICPACYTFIDSIGMKKVVCKCGHVDVMENVILQHVEEIKLLFPGIKITTCCVFDWCKVIVSKKQIGRVLKKNFNKKGSGKWSYYE